MPHTNELKASGNDFHLGPNGELLSGLNFEYPAATILPDMDPLDVQRVNSQTAIALLTNTTREQAQKLLDADARSQDLATQVAAAQAEIDRLKAEFGSGPAVPGAKPKPKPSEG